MSCTSAGAKWQAGDAENRGRYAAQILLRNGSRGLCAKGPPKPPGRGKAPRGGRGPGAN